ncbi:uncharacterized protein Nmlp_3347 [Natronomonas moolapensis 8.8.11]|uniref:Uncharacterized protein n=1 Tax=Natronomonas moolapensis (strain DSM 18674 / CECT 7526 / JCM 14361 / 8.8.11) TaxID=268739 RepID=M1XSV9_NATM8|nr:hypothetical protein [Natronomonas moolapensis]CCQ37477.1 uncharacterized protein Nmlp_3347 [Natronomonas moolapensis 8.8.11]
MDAVDFGDPPAAPADGPQSVRCTACDAALRSPGRDTVSFLLIDHLTIPLVGCPDHIEQFGTVCGLTTEESTTILKHRPAGGIQCPGCRRASHRHRHPVVAVGAGAIGVLACPAHQDDVVGRYRAGLRTRHHLTESIASHRP